MTIFVILLSASNPILSKRIVDTFNGDCLSLNETQWLVSSSATVQEVTAKAGIYDASNADNPSLGNAVVFATTSYYGFASTTVWDWIRSRLETKANA